VIIGQDTDFELREAQLTICGALGSGFEVEAAPYESLSCSSSSKSVIFQLPLSAEIVRSAS